MKPHDLFDAPDRSSNHCDHLVETAAKFDDQAAHTGLYHLGNPALVGSIETDRAGR